MVNLGLKCALGYLCCISTDLNVISLAFISFIDFNKEVRHSFSEKNYESLIPMKYMVSINIFQNRCYFNNLLVVLLLFQETDANMLLTPRSLDLSANKTAMFKIKVKKRKKISQLL